MGNWACQRWTIDCQPFFWSLIQHKSHTKNISLSGKHMWHILLNKENNRNSIKNKWETGAHRWTSRVNHSWFDVYLCCNNTSNAFFFLQPHLFPPFIRVGCIKSTLLGKVLWGTVHIFKNKIIQALVQQRETYQLIINWDLFSCFFQHFIISENVTAEIWEYVTI